jgi:hypothetical protein
MSEIKTDKLTGKTTAGNVTVTSEGGAVTQSLQQGLAKAWVNYDGKTTNSVRDSLNTSSVSDNGTGDYSVTYSSNLSNANYTASLSSDNQNNGGWRVIFQFNSSTPRTTSLIRTFSGGTDYDVASAAGDFLYVDISLHGDLA